MKLSTDLYPSPNVTFAAQAPYAAVFLTEFHLDFWSPLGCSTVAHAGFLGDLMGQKYHCCLSVEIGFHQHSPIDAMEKDGWNGSELRALWAKPSIERSNAY